MTLVAVLPKLAMVHVRRTMQKKHSDWSSHRSHNRHRRMFADQPPVPQSMYYPLTHHILDLTSRRRACCMPSST